MAEEDLSGHKLGDFVLREKIGSGGWGFVYRAEQPALKREVAVKVLRHREGDGVELERFKREAQLVSRLNHPYAAQIYAYGVVEQGEDEGLRWIAMELVQGVTLSEWLKTYGPMSLGQFVQFFECVAEVVHLAHERGIVHRDLKPSNMMVIEVGGRLLPKLLDFGIAKVTHEVAFPEDHRSRDKVVTAQLRPEPRPGAYRTGTDPGSQKAKHELTRSGVGFGSGPYTAPEQWGNARAVGRAADIYSLGIVIYEALSGRRPYIADSADEYCRLHCKAPVPELGVGFDFSKAVDRVLRFALAKYPEDRQATALELASELRVVLRASDREQLRSSAQQWWDRDGAPDLLWGAGLLAELEGVVSRALAGEFTPLECSFAAASQRQARHRRWVRRSLVALAATLAVLGACGFLLYRAEMQTRMLQDRAVMQTRMADQIATEAEVEQGRQAGLHGESSEAVRHLEQAYQRGDHSPGVAFMLARALQPRMSELARFKSSAGRMWSAAFAPDGKRVLTTDDQSAQMWDASSSQLLFTMSHGGEPVYGAVFSPDGSGIVTAGGDGTVRIWSAATGAPVRVLRSQRSDVKQWRYYAVAMSPQVVAAIDLTGKTVHVWDADTGTHIAELDNDAPEMALLAFSADGRWLATSGRDEARIFDTSTWRRVTTIVGPRIRSLRFDPTGARIAVGTYDGAAAIWEVPSGRRLRSLRDAGASVDAVAFSRDGVLVATASRDGTEQVWDAASGGLRTEFNSHHDKIHAVEFSGLGDLLLSAGADGAAVISNVATGMIVARLEGPRGLVFTAHFDAASRRVVGASFDGTARVWDAAPPYRRWDSPQVGAECDTLENLVPDQRFIALSCRNHGTHVWDTARGELLAELPGVTSVGGDFASALPALTSTGDRAAIARGNTVEVYVLPSGQLLRAIAHAAAVNAVAFAPEGHDLVSGAVDGSLLLTHDERAPVVLPTSPAGIDAAAILTDGRVVVADASGRLRVIDPDGKALRMDIAAPSRIRLLRPSPDGRRLVAIAATSEQTPPVLWDLDQYRQVARLEGHIGRVFSARFVDPGGHEILTAGADGTARLWDAATGRRGQSFRDDSHFLVDAALAPGGAVLVAGGSDGFLRFWDTLNGRLLWMLQAHRSYVVGVHYEGDELVTRGFAGDVARWALPPPARIIESCHATGCASAGSAGR